MLNGTATTGSDVVVEVELENFAPVRDRITLNLTANRTLVDQRSVAVGADGRRTVYLRTTFERTGRYALRVNGVEAGTVTVRETETGTPTSPRTSSSSPSDTPGTPAQTTTERPEATDDPGRSPTSTPTATGPVSPGPDEPTGTEAIVALGMSLMLLYGVGVVVYVLQE